MKFVMLVLIVFLVEQGCFKIVQHYYCHKNKGNCSNCKDWSCPRKIYVKYEK